MRVGRPFLSKLAEPAKVFPFFTNLPKYLRWHQIHTWEDMLGGGVFDAGVSTWGVNQSLIKINITNNIISDEWITSNIWYDISWYNRKDVLCVVGYHLWPANSAENPISPPYSFILASALHFSIIRLCIAGQRLLEARVKKWERKVKVTKLKWKKVNVEKVKKKQKNRMWNSESETSESETRTSEKVKVKRWK